jgi:thiol-disulfide isomerase/thioredoxin
MQPNQILKHALSYSDYRQLIDKLVEEGKTTGTEQSPALLDFTKLNIQRMNRLDKTFSITESTSKRLSQLKNAFTILLVGDAWCGDSAQIIPVVNKIAEASGGKIDLKIISRDDDPEFSATYKARSIPKLFFIAPNSGEMKAEWGPRPKAAQAIAKRWKESAGATTKEAFELELHTWYARDKGKSIEDELLQLISELDAIPAVKMP